MLWGAGVWMWCEQGGRRDWQDGEMRGEGVLGGRNTFTLHGDSINILWVFVWVMAMEGCVNCRRKGEKNLLF